MWREINKKYECNESGTIRNSKTKHIIKQFKGKDGYMRVSLYIDGKSKTFTVHRLILSSFVKNPNQDIYTEINHIDGNKENNCIDNLEWCTRSENQLHAYKNNLQTDKKGERNGRSVLTENDVTKIREMLGKKTQREIAHLYHVSKSTISAIKNGIIWNF